MAHVRSPVLSGSWYPADPAVLARTVDGYLAGAEPQKRPAGRPRVAVVPHAGYTYSGAVAGRLYGLLRAHEVARVFVLAPSHRVPLRAIALSDADAFATPLGEVAVDRAAVGRLARHDAFVVDERAHRDEHAVEIQLPFLQRALAPGFRIVPLLVPGLERTRREAAASLLADEAKDDDLLLVSTDFTHYGANYGYLPFREDIPANLEKLDTGAILRILAHDADGLLAYGRETGITMCGIEAAALALSGSPPAGHEAALVDYARSGDRDADYNLSVSYAAILLTSTALTAGERTFLLSLARAAVASAVHDEPAPIPAELARDRGTELSDALRRKRGAFVTLKHDGRLRGCIGYIEPACTLADAVVANARSAAIGDPRFPPVSAAELPELELEISALTPLRDVSGPDEIVAGRHGVVLRKGKAQAVFLPQVAVEQGWDRETMLAHLARKAGLPPDGWRKGAEFAIFEAELLEDPSP